jgi:hypothetical protein
MEPLGATQGDGRDDPEKTPKFLSLSEEDTGGPMWGQTRAMARPAQKWEKNYAYASMCKAH